MPQTQTQTWEQIRSPALAGQSRAEVALVKPGQADLSRLDRPRISGAMSMDAAYMLLEYYARWKEEEWLTISALWAAHTWFRGLDEKLLFEATPRLTVVAPPESGKTRIGRLIRGISWRPTPLARGVVTAEGVREALKENRTVFLDEAHRIFGDAGTRRVDLQAILTGGYTPEGGALNARGGKYNPADDFGPVALLAQPSLVSARAQDAIGDLIGRSFMILPEHTAEPIPDLGSAYREQSALVARALEIWAQDCRPESGILEPVHTIPEGLSSRKREIALPLLAIADRAVDPDLTADGGMDLRWAIKARRAVEVMLLRRDEARVIGQLKRQVEAMAALQAAGA